MFGQSGNSQDNVYGDGGNRPEPADDGTLGVPLPDPHAPVSVPVNVGNSDSSAPTSNSSMTPSDNPPPASPSISLSGGEDNLLGIKQQALQQLKPLVGHLDQTPEERFRTTMMMIQAADDQSLINDAYEAAKGISDEKIRAQALLDIVNEINYFTTQK